MSEIIRTRKQGCFRIATTHWGHHLTRADDPEGEHDITEDDLKEFKVREDLPRIPASLWQRWVKLAMHLAPGHTASLEVGVRILVNIADPTKYRILVPKQSVSGGSVHCTDFNGSIDIETGEVIDEWWPEGWDPCGSSHSHGTMGAFWSGTDDRNELGDPGLHITVGAFNQQAKTYNLCASITGNFRRFRIDHDLVVDTSIEGVEDVTFHPDVLNWINQGYDGTRKQVPGYSWLPSGRRTTYGSGSDANAYAKWLENRAVNGSRWSDDWDGYSTSEGFWDGDTYRPAQPKPIAGNMPRKPHGQAIGTMARYMCGRLDQFIDTPLDLLPAIDELKNLSNALEDLFSELNALAEDMQAQEDLDAIDFGGGSDSSANQSDTKLLAPAPNAPAR